MKKLLSLTGIILLFALCYNTGNAQNDKRYNIEMSFTYKGKLIKCTAISASYSLSRDIYGQDSLSSTPKTIYVTVAPVKVEKELLLAIKDKKAQHDILITMTDSFGKEPKKEILLKNTTFSAIADSFTTYGYEGIGAMSLSLMANGVEIDGVEIEP